jgi:hypothetical protein
VLLATRAPCTVPFTMFSTILNKSLLDVKALVMRATGTESSRG